MIVEDNEDIAEFLIMTLASEMGCRCVLAHNGFQAMERLTTPVPNLLIVDYQLPNMNGLEFYDHFHQRENLQLVELSLGRMRSIKAQFLACWTQGAIALCLIAKTVGAEERGPVVFSNSNAISVRRGVRNVIIL